MLDGGGYVPAGIDPTPTQNRCPVDMQTVLSEVDSWPIEDRIQLVQEVWDRLADQGQEPGLSEEDKAELDRRLAEDDAAPDDVVPWEEVKAQALARIQR